MSARLANAVCEVVVKLASAELYLRVSPCFQCVKSIFQYFLLFGFIDFLQASPSAFSCSYCFLKFSFGELPWCCGFAHCILGWLAAALSVAGDHLSECSMALQCALPESRPFSQKFVLFSLGLQC